MLKFLIITLVAIHCNCQKLIEIGGDSPRSIRIANSGPVVSGLSSVRTVGGISSFGVQPLGATVVSPGAYGLGLSQIGGYRSFGLGQVALRPSVGLLSAYQPAVHQVAVAQPAVQTVAVQPAVQTVAVQPAVQTVAVSQPAVQTVAVSQPAVYSAGVQTQQQVVPVSAAIQQVGRTVEYRSVPYNDEPIVPQVVEVEPSDIPLHIHFKSRSSSIRLSQEHIPGEPGTVEQTSSQDEPSKVVHEVVKPVIQEVREVIQPYRQLSQEIQPVVENVHTVVAKGEGERRQYVAQQYVARQVQPVAQYQTIAQPVARVQVAQPVVSQYQVAQPVVSSYQVAQPALSAYQVAQPALSAYQVAQPALSAYQIAQPALSAYQIAQPVVGVQSYRSVVQPQSVYTVQQPAVSVIGSGSLLNSGLLSSRYGSLVNVQSQPIVGQLGSVSYSRTFAESERK